METPAEKHEIAGVDTRKRGFTRMAEIQYRVDAFQAIFQYEQSIITGEPAPETTLTLTSLVQALQGKGYTQLRSRISFRGEEYLGTQELWVDYPDPAPEPSGLGPYLRRLLQKFRRADSKPTQQ